MNNQQRIKEAFDRLQIEQEIYLRVFNNPTPGIINNKYGEDVVNLCNKRIQNALQSYRIALRWDDITECARCRTNGISEDDECSGDDANFNILKEQTDSDSQFYNQLLCDECMAKNDHYLANRDITGRGE